MFSEQICVILIDYKNLAVSPSNLLSALLPLKQIYFDPYKVQ